MSKTSFSEQHDKPARMIQRAYLRYFYKKNSVFQKLKAIRAPNAPGPQYFTLNDLLNTYESQGYANAASANASGPNVSEPGQPFSLSDFEVANHAMFDAGQSGKAQVAKTP